MPSAMAAEVLRAGPGGKTAGSPGLEVAIGPLVALLIGLLATPAPLRAAPGPPAQAPADTVRAAVLVDWPPHYRVTPDGEPTGFGVDVMRSVARQSGLAVRFVPFRTFPDAMEGLRSGAVDVIPDLGIIPSRDGDFAFTRPFEAFRVSVFTRASAPRLEGPEELGGKRVGVVRSNVAVELLRREHPDAEPVVFENVREALLELLAAGVDAVAYPEEVFLGLAREAELADRIRSVPGPLTEVPRGMGVRSDDTALRERLDLGVEALVGTPEFEAVYQRWFRPAATFWTVERVAWLAGGLLLLVLLGMGLWRYRSVSRMAARLRRSLEERKEAEAARQRQEARFRTVVDAAYEGIALVDAENRLTFVNRRACEITGREPEELVGESFFRFVSEDDRERSRLGADRRRGGASDSYEVRVGHADGGDVWILVSVAPILDDSGDFAGSVATFADITDRKRAEEELEETTRVLRRTLASLDAAVLTVDPEERTIVECNDAAEEVFGYSRAALLGSDTRMLHVDDEHVRRFEELSTAPLEKGESFRGDFEMRRADGSVFPTRHVVSLLDPEVGVDGGVVSVVWDVSERRRAESRLRESEERFRQIAERIGDVFWISSPDKDEMEYVSPAYADIWGRPTEDVYENTSAWLEAIHPDDRERVREALSGQAEGTYEEEYRIVRPDGEVRWIWDRAFPVSGDDGRVRRIVGVAEDVTDRVRAERELRERERRFRAFVENASDLISTLDGDGRMMYQSPPVKRLLGYEPEELRGRPVFEMMHPEDREAARAAWSDLVEEPGATVRPPSFRFLHRDGTWRVWEATLTNLLDDPAVGAVLSNARDVTEREELERRLRHSQKLEAVGRLAGGVAHDFNNLLTIIRANAEFLDEVASGADGGEEHVEEIRQASVRGSELTRQLLAFSRDQVLEARPVLLNDTVRAMERLLRRVIGEDVELVTDLAVEVPAVEIDPGQLEQVIMNLAVNARDAMPDGGTLEVTTVRVELDAEEAARLGLATAGSHVRLSVRDTGIGMDQETRERIFEPFFTTKPQESGTGLGLATVYGVVEQSGGAIGVESEPGKGATFRLHFPVTDEAPEPDERASEPTGPPRPSEHRDADILVVEDDAGVRRALERALGRHGHSVAVAEGIEPARTILRTRDGSFDLVFTDVVLPDGSGVDLIEHVLEEHPGTRIVAMSGYSRHEVLQERILEKGIRFLQKPFTPARIAELALEVLVEAGREAR